MEEEKVKKLIEILNDRVGYYYYICMHGFAHRSKNKLTFEELVDHLLNDNVDGHNGIILLPKYEDSSNLEKLEFNKSNTCIWCTKKLGSCKDCKRMSWK